MARDSKIMTRIAVSDRLIRWAVRRSGREDSIKRRFPKLERWANREELPTLRQLEKLAKATATPLGYFFLSEPPEDRLPIPYFRTLREQSTPQPSPDLLETVQMMERRQAWMREYLIELGQEPLSFVRSARLTDQPQRIANEMRRTLGIDQKWAAEQPTWVAALRELQSRMEQAGILVVVNSIVGNNTYRKLDPVEFRGFVLVDEYAPLVFVNGSDGRAARMFTLAHELAHVWFGSSAAFDLRDMQPADDAREKACDRLAAEFLVPERELSRLWPSVQRSLDRFEQVARQFKVSQLVAVRRALDLGLATRADFLDFFRAYQEADRRTAAKKLEGGDFYANQSLRIGSRFAEAVVCAVREGRLLYSEAYRLTGLYGKTFDRYAESLRLGGSL